MTAQDFMGTGASAGGITAIEQTYAPWQFYNDLLNLTGPAATAPVLMQRGELVSKDKKVSLRDAMANLHTMDEKQLGDLTQRMYAAGFYKDAVYSKGHPPPNGKVVDDDTLYAAYNLYSTTARYAGNKSATDVLNEFAQQGEGQKKITNAQSKTQGQVYTVTSDDPATLRAQVTKTAQVLLGRSVSDTERDALVSLMVQQEQAPQQAAIQAGQTADTGSDVRLATARVDAKARLNEKLKADNSTETQAYSQLNYYNVLSQALKGNG